MSKKSNELNIFSSIQDVKGIGPKKAEALSRLGLKSLRDVLLYYPKSYEDLRNPALICDLSDGQKALICARVLLVTPGKGFGRKRTLHLLIEDKTGRANVVFFMAGYMMNKFKIGEEYYFFGKVKLENGRTTLFHPEYHEKTDEERGIMPVYPLTSGISQKDIRNLSKCSCGFADELPESLPAKIIEKAKLCSNSSALREIHYPESEDEFKTAKYRLVYEELFDFRLALKLSGNSRNKDTGTLISSHKAEEFISSLNFDLTSAQKRVLDEILSDMRSRKNMNRLVQGDVGCGKTVVAEAALFEAVFAGFQGLFMVPTEILANQHYQHLIHDFEPFGVKVVLLVSSLNAKEKKQALEEIKSGEAQVIIGTHALIQEAVEYKNVGLVITDEQHRFGVSQRRKLSEKGLNPDILVMTATPIPRTLAVTLYADYDVSSIDEMPPGRKKVLTYRFSESERKDAYKILISEIEKGRQAFIVAPFIEDSETLSGRSSTTLYNAFVKKHPEISCRLLHGELSEDEKDEIMQDFAAGKVSLLISTVVIEVGIDIPNASVMLVENTERFGLAQLHQLRGRVGRGEYESYCLLCLSEESDIAKQRAEIMCKTSNGFEIAEKDLELRGPGELFGYRQHGIPQLFLADPIKHKDIFKKVNADIDELLESDPDLLMGDNAILRDKINEKFVLVENLTI